MAADPMTGFDPDNDEDLKQANARFAAAGDQAKANAAQDAFAKASPAPQQQTSGLQHWFQDLPQNVGSGLITAAVNTADAMHSGLRYVDQKAKEAHKALGGESADAQTRADQGEAPETPEYATVRNAVNDFKQKYVDVPNPDMSDNITQGVAQFAIPFLGWSKAVSVVGGVGKLAAAGRTLLAESATASTVMAPHDGRFADMLDLGRHTEGKFADALNAISPDGSLVNNYINWMTADKDSEGEFEGRAKNILDTIAGGAVLSPLIHAGFGMLKGGMAGLKYAMENGVGSLDQLGQGPALQAGRIGYHGTPHDFDTQTGFDDSRIGSGEGNQVYGYGHYLAESPDVAEGYQGRLSAQGLHPDVISAQEDIANAGGSKQKAFVALNKQADSSTNPAEKMFLQRKAQLIKNGAADTRGSLVTADVADSHVDNMLDWDKPLSEQPDVAKNLSKLGIDPTDDAHMDMTGKDIYRSFEARGFTPKTISSMFDEAGVPGIKYLDGQSRDSGNGTRNLVVFKGKNIAVTAKNGKPVGIEAAPRSDMSLTADQRALERERVAAQRQREDGILPDHVPEIIPRRAAETEGEAARRDARS